jgi:hypothetical protein
MRLSKIAGGDAPAEAKPTWRPDEEWTRCRECGSRAKHGTRCGNCGHLVDAPTA